MLSIDYKQPMSRVRWNLWNQTVLCCMFRFFHKDKEVFSRVFESLFSGDLQAFDHELPYGTLNTQWCDLRRHGDPVWHRVHICIAFPASGPWLQLLSSIKERAISLGFSLVEKQIDDIDTSIFRLNPARRRNRRDLPSETYDSTPSSTQSSSSSSWQVLSGQPGPPEVSDETDAASPAPPCTPEEEFCLESNNEEPEPGKIDRDEYFPRILYRWSNIDSQGANTRALILAGLFANTEESFFSPEEIPKPDFDNYVRSHVNISKTVSPFVSTFNSPLAPVHRSLRAREGALISIIDSSRLEGYVYSARQLVRDLDIQIPGYRGIGEYLIWGRVPTPAIICSFTITELVRIANDDAEIGQLLQLDRIEAYKRNQPRLKRALSRGPGKLDWRSGCAVGRLLEKLNLPVAHIDKVALAICRSWQFSRSGSEHDYSRGARHGYMSLPSPLDMHLDSTGPVQRGLSPSTEDESDIVIIDEEPEDEDDCIPSIESSYSSPQQSITTQCPTVEYFDPAKQQWTQNIPETPVVSSGPPSSVVMNDNDIEFFVGELD